MINAIIHRSLGPDYSGMMSQYYANTRGVARLLRPQTAQEQDRIRRIGCRLLRARAEERGVLSAWTGLYAGSLVADDVRDLARDHLTQVKLARVRLLGDHEALTAGRPADGEAAQTLAGALDATLKAMNGSGIFRSPNGRDIGYVAPNAIVADRYQVRDTVCQRREDPRTWTDHVNDQCIAIG